MRHFLKPDREQIVLVTEARLDTLAPEGSALRNIDRLVDVLDTGEIEKTYDLESPVGRNELLSIGV